MDRLQALLRESLELRRLISCLRPETRGDDVIYALDGHYHHEDVAWTEQGPNGFIRQVYMVDRGTPVATVRELHEAYRMMQQ